MNAAVPANIEVILEPMKDVQKMIGAMLVANERAFNAHLEQMKVRVQTDALEKEKVRQRLPSDDFDPQIPTEDPLRIALRTMKNDRWVHSRCPLANSHHYVAVPFITCDNPFFYDDPTVPLGFFYGVGLSDNNREMFFLSRVKCRRLEPESVPPP